MKTFKQHYNTKIKPGEPAMIENADGTKAWFLNGRLHRDGDLPAVIFRNGQMDWYKNGQRHREGGPAIVMPHGAKFWYQNGERHREDGPAVEYSGGRKEWWLNGTQFTEDAFKRYQMTKKLSSDTKDAFGDILDNI